MSQRLLTFISEFGWFRVLAVLPERPQARNLREVSELSGISLGGTSDIMRRLESAGLVIRNPKGRRAMFCLNLDPADLLLFRQIAAAKVKINLERRAEVLSGKRKSAIGWADKTRSILKHGKRSGKNTARSA